MRPCLHNRRLREAAALSSIVVVAVLVRAVYYSQFSKTLLFDVAIGPDVREYDAWAREILGGRTVWTHLHIHAPLYPYVLACFYAVTRASIGAVRAVQLGLDVASMLLTYASLRLLWGKRPAVLLGLLWSVYLPLVYFSAELVSEGLLVFVLSCVLFVWACAYRLCNGRPRLRTGLFLLIGVLLGLAALTHPLSLAFGVCFAPLAGWLVHVQSGIRAGRQAALLISLGLVAVLTPVAWRNTAVSGEFVLVQAQEGLNFYIGNNPEATGTCYVRPGPAYDRLVRWPRLEGCVGESEAKRFYYRRALEFIEQHPFRWLGLLLKKLMLTWSAHEITSGPDLPELRSQTALMRVPLPRFGVVAPLAVAGIWLSRKRRESYVFLLVIASYCAGLTVFVTSGRYRLGMVPAVLAMAAVGLDRLVLAWRQDDTRTCVTGLGLVLLGLVIAFARPPPRMAASESESLGLLAEAAWLKGDHRGAEQCLGRALELDPNDAGFCHLMGVVLAETGRRDDAIRYYRKALELDPHRPKARVDYAIALSEMGQPDKARTELMQVLDTHPENADAWYNLGVLDETIGDVAQALERYERALTLRPSFVSAHLNYGVLCHRQERRADAARHYRIASRLAPGKARVYVCLAVLHADSGEPEAAESCFRRALSLDPRQPEIRSALAELLASHRQSDEARKGGERVGAPTAPQATNQMEEPGK